MRGVDELDHVAQRQVIVIVQRERERVVVVVARGAAGCHTGWPDVEQIAKKSRGGGRTRQGVAVWPAAAVCGMRKHEWVAREAGGAVRGRHKCVAGGLERAELSPVKM
jgi:nanoRNase/pAp phosphatase (c-di-AMP/oligoRNAs hydrolase)